MIRRTFRLSASFAQEVRQNNAWTIAKNGDIRIHRYLQSIGFRPDLPIQTHTQIDGGILYVQDVPDDVIPTYDLVSLILLEGGFPKESVQRVLVRAYEEDRDPVEIAREEVELVRKRETS